MAARAGLYYCRHAAVIERRNVLVFDTLKEKIFGVIIISQSSRLSTIGLIRTIDLLKQRQIHIPGLVANEDGFRTKEGRLEHHFLSPRTGLKKICNLTVFLS